MREQRIEHWLAQVISKQTEKTVFCTDSILETWVSRKGLQTILQYFHFGLESAGLLLNSLATQWQLVSVKLANFVDAIANS